MLGNHRVIFDVDRAGAGSGFVWLDGSAISLSVGSPVSVVGGKVFEVSPKQFQVVWDTGETMNVTNYGTWLGVSTQLSSIDRRGSVEGLLSSNIHPDAWRVTDAASLFNFPEPSTLDGVSQTAGSTTVTGSPVSRAIEAEGGLVDFKSAIVRGIGTLDIGATGRPEAVNSTHGVNFVGAGGTLALGKPANSKGRSQTSPFPTQSTCLAKGSRASPTPGRPRPVS